MNTVAKYTVRDIDTWLCRSQELVSFMLSEMNERKHELTPADLALIGHRLRIASGVFDFIGSHLDPAGQGLPETSSFAQIQSAEYAEIKDRCDAIAALIAELQATVVSLFVTLN